MEVEECLSYVNMMLLELSVDGYEQLYIAEVLYSGHHKGHMSSPPPQ